MNLDGIKARCEAVPKLTPYVTSRGGVVIFNGPFPMDKAEAAKGFIVHAQRDVRELVAEVERLRGVCRTACGILDKKWERPRSEAEQAVLDTLNEVIGGWDEASQT